MTEETSKWYWLLPIIFNWLGGFTGWLVLKDKDREKADNILITGLIVFGLIVLSIAIWMFGFLAI